MEEKQLTTRKTPIGFYCIHDMCYPTSNNQWNASVSKYCTCCVNFSLGLNPGFCWYCYSCNHYLFSYITGKEVILYNTSDTTKNNGCFKRCITCKSLWLIHDNKNVTCCSNYYNYCLM